MHENSGKKMRIILISSSCLLAVILFIRAPQKKYFSWWDKSKYEIWSNFVEKTLFYYEGVDGTAKNSGTPEKSAAKPEKPVIKTKADAAKALRNGEITNQEYIDYLKKLKK